MSERDCHGDIDGTQEFVPPRASRAGRRSGVILPMAERSSPGQDTDTILLESLKAAPRRSSIIKVETLNSYFIHFPETTVA